ncbi:Lar family restriction alleviation protein [Comamonas aquatica]|uniref:Lar family restriction alleviation protein n=1 Tax=Comamonas aquatica TaxID=225991 RepID=UPI002449F51D|nr:Lar family restriction alleviation protein [Comamonas aquatica]MDH0897971.1 Lar family restriction alleviation protein [Comamonas aquatica]
MTHHTDAELLPCPFCGCEAHFEMDDDRWEWIECGSCGMQGNRSASLMEDCKPKLAEAWNRRAPAAPVPQGWKLVPVESTEAMARAFRADDAPGYFCMTTLRCADFSERYAAMLAAAPQPPEHTPSEHSKPMCGAAPKVDPIAWYVTGCSTMLDEYDAKAEAKRCGGTAQAVPLYAAPQPQEAQASVSNGTFAAPVQMPEPVAKIEGGSLKWHIPDAGYSLPLIYLQGTQMLYTEQQVRQLLANHGIQERST